MNPVVAYTTLALVVGLAVFRPRIAVTFRFSPGTAAMLGVVVLLATGLLTPAMLVEAARLQWRTLLALISIMVMTGVVQEVGAFDRLAAAIERRARVTSAVQTFTLVFALAVITPSLLNNDAAILILTPLVVALTRRLYPGRVDITIAFAFAVFLAPGVAPLIVSNPMNMIVAEFAQLGFNAYAAVMVPISIAGAVVTYAVLRLVYRKLLAGAVPSQNPIATTIHAHAGELPAVILMLAVLGAYPIVAWLDGPTWLVAVSGAIASLGLARAFEIAPAKKVVRHVSLDILLFLWGIFLVVASLRSVGVVDYLGHVYQGERLATVGVVSAVGSALIDNHPMSILNMLALDGAHGTKPILAALVGGDIGPRLLPIGSLAGLLWMDLLRRSGIEIGIGRFLRLGTLVLLPTLLVSLTLLWLL